MANVYENLIPRAMAREILQVTERQSAVLALGRNLTMPSGLVSIPIVSFLPVAGWVNPRYGGRKPATKIEWSSEEIVPAEVAATLALPENWITDAGFDVWANVRPTLVTALSRVIDDAILFGNGEPATFPPNGVVGAGAPVGGPDALAALDAGFDAVEASGLDVTGIGSRVQIKSALRAEYRAIGATPDTVPTLSYAGVPIVTSPEWDTAKCDAVVGDWTKLVIGIREDISFRTSDSAVLLDGGGVIIANSFQDNLIALKVWMKIGAAIGTPVAPDNASAVNAFVAVDWTP